MVHLVSAWAEAIMKNDPAMEISVTGGGSGTGIAAMLNKTTDIAASSRNVREKEITLAESKGINMNAPVVLFGLLAFVASYAMSLGPVMWAMLAEIFPNQSRALAISVVGVVNSLSSFLVQFLFPWELMNLGAAVTFASYGIFALISLVLVVKLFPETKGRSLEQISEGL
ncbi:MAG: MFS transporter [Candidatus Marinimicrobia bacterium]|nr:MFS transporter [Candidatus Neomarinimicrobiota bacterium]